MILETTRLRIRIEEPGQRYRGTRFDHTSTVSSIVLDNGTEFLSQELAQADARPDRGIGLSCEFGIRTPIGYADCPAGDWFPKIGLGLIRRDGPGEYDFFATAAGVRPAETTWTQEAGPDRASLVFRQVMAAHRGYGWRMERRWDARGASLSSTVRLENTGSQALSSDEYCHNFLRPGPQGALGAHRLSLHAPWPLPEAPAGVVDPHGVLGFAPAAWHIAGPSDSDLYVPWLSAGQPAGAWWELRIDGRPWVRETLDSALTRCDLWGKTHVISPELFTAFHILPGQAASWTRRWDFGPA